MACEREIEIDSQEAPEKIIVEGFIEPGLPPIIILTKSQAYFGATDINNLSNSYIHNASITINSGTYEAELFEICTSFLLDTLTQNQIDTLAIALENFGINTDILNLELCIYTSFDVNIFGEIGKSYRLNINAEGENLTSTTRIPEAVPLDSIWYRQFGDNDSLGVIWATLTDPDTLNNAYRFYYQRLGKDNRFIAPFGSPFYDEFFNGLSFDFAYDTSTPQLIEEFDEGLYKLGDTIAIKFCSMPIEAYNFLSLFEINIFNTGSPFASPNNVPSNVNNGLGLWVGYSPSYDTIIAAE